MSGVENFVSSSLSEATDPAGRRSHSRASPTTSDELSTSDKSQGGGVDDGDGSTALLSSHDGPQTGVKGVRADAAQRAREERSRKHDEIRAVNARMESMALGKHRTWKEDVEEQKREAEESRKTGTRQSNEDDDGGEQEDEDEELRAIQMRRLQSIKSQAAAQESRRKRLAGEGEDNRSSGRQAYGHLREVGHDQYVQAVEGGGDASTYVVVHIYVKYVHACAMLTSALSSLARMHPKTKFVQVRAGKIGFGSGGLQDKADEDIDEDELDEHAEDVVPTLLVYKAGKVVANLVRLDLDPTWGDGSERCIQDILQTYGALH